MLCILFQNEDLLRIKTTLAFTIVVLVLRLNLRVVGRLQQSTPDPECQMSIVTMPSKCTTCIYNTELTQKPGEIEWIFLVVYIYINHFIHEMTTGKAVVDSSLRIGR